MNLDPFLAGVLERSAQTSAENDIANTNSELGTAFSNLLQGDTPGALQSMAAGLEQLNAAQQDAALAGPQFQNATAPAMNQVEGEFASLLALMLGQGLGLSQGLGQGTPFDGGFPPGGQLSDGGNLGGVGPLGTVDFSGAQQALGDFGSFG